MTKVPLLFAFVAGTVASANPCGFAILPAFFLSYLRAPDTAVADSRHRVVEALLVGAAMTAAFVLVFGLVGAGMAAGATVLMAAMPWATLVVGALLMALGIFALGGRPISVRLPDPLSGKGGYRGPFFFGAAYAVASLSCTAPVFLSVVGASLGRSGALLRGGMFLAYALGMGTILTGLALGAALARGGINAALRKLVPHVSRVSSVFLLASGAYLIYYWTFFLLPGSERRTAGKGPIDFMNGLAAQLQAWLHFGAGAWLGPLLLAVIVTLVGFLSLRRLRSRASAAEPAEIESKRP